MTVPAVAATVAGFLPAALGVAALSLPAALGMATRSLLDPTLAWPRQSASLSFAPVGLAKTRVPAIWLPVISVPAQSFPAAARE